MLMEQTLQTLNALRLPGMATGFAEQQSKAATMNPPFNERLTRLDQREPPRRYNPLIPPCLPEALVNVTPRPMRGGAACMAVTQSPGG